MQYTLQFSISGMQSGEKLVLCSFIWSVKFAYKRFESTGNQSSLHLQDLDIEFLATWGHTRKIPEWSGVKGRFRAAAFLRLAKEKEKQSRAQWIPWDWLTWIILAGSKLERWSEVAWHLTSCLLRPSGRAKGWICIVSSCLSDLSQGLAPWLSLKIF